MCLKEVHNQTKSSRKATILKSAVATCEWRSGKGQPLPYSLRFLQFVTLVSKQFLLWTVMSQTSEVSELSVCGPRYSPIAPERVEEAPAIKVEVKAEPLNEFLAAGPIGQVLI